jgi:uroporphyrinogen decarboxylase
MLRLCTSPEYAAEVTLQPLRRFPLDGAILFADLPQVAHALGQSLEYREGDGPLLDPVIRSTLDSGPWVMVALRVTDHMRRFASDHG